MEKGQKIVVTLGRVGDVINGLPIAYAIWKESGIRPKFVVAKPFEEILRAVSYVEPVVWDVDYADLGYVIQQFYRSHPELQDQAIICQCYGHHSDHGRLTDSYQKESWRIAGWLDRWGTIPTVIDKRDLDREEALAARCLPFNGKPIILFGGSGVSSPFPNAPELLQKLRNEIPEANVVDLSQIQAYAVYDLMGLFDRAHLLVSVDTVFLHLARAQDKIPVISIINNFWYGSIPPPRSKAVFRYSGIKLDQVVAEAKKAIA